MISVDSWRGRIVLVVAHCAGMVDLVALPLWVGTLVARYGFDPQQAGGLATLFLAGVMLASALLAPRFHRLRGRRVAASGFGVAAIGCALAAAASSFGALAALHALCGLATGTALSVTHGTIARSARPQRLFAVAGTGLGVFAVLFMLVTPLALNAAGGSALFMVFGAVMAVAALACALAFPHPSSVTGPATPAAGRRSLSPAVWFGIFGIALMSVVQAMTFSFVERVGHERGFGSDAVNGALVAIAFVTLLPAPLAGLMEKRLPPKMVLLAGPVLHGLMAVTVVVATTLPPYVAAASMLPCIMVFTHTFAFGLLAKIDLSGRALAATPAMLMVGSAVGPVLGGTIVRSLGYGSLGIGAVCLSSIAFLCFTRLPSAKRAAESPNLPERPIHVES